MTVKTLITFKDFWKFYLKNSFLLFIIVPILVIIFLIFKNLMSTEQEQSIFETASIWLILVFVFLGFRTYFKVKRAFYSNKKIQERNSYTFTHEKIHIQGETFESDYSWNSIHQVKELKDWFLIYQSLQVMNMVPKKDFTKEQVSELRNIIKHAGVKAKLRND